MRKEASAAIGSIRKKLAGLLLWVTAAAGLFLLAGCGSQIREESGGIRFLKPENLGGYDFLQFCKDQDVYICDIGNADTAELVVPAQYKKKPVVAVISTAFGGNNTLASLKIEEGILYLESIKEFSALKKVELPSSAAYLTSAFQKCPALEEIVFPGKIKRIGGFSFEKCGALQRAVFRDDVETLTDFAFSGCGILSEVIFEKNVTELRRYVFQNCYRLTSVELPAGVAIDETVFARPYDYEPAWLSQTVLDYDLTYDAEAVRQAALSVLGSEPDPQKEIRQEEAKELAGLLNGPILVTEKCPDCHFYEYSPEAIPKDLALRLIPVSEIEFAFSGTVYTEEKAAAAAEKKAPLVFCLYEYIGYSDGPEYVVGGKIAYHLWVRVSFWDAEQKSLLAWYTVKTGDAPATYNLGKDKISFELPTGERTEYFFLNADGKRPIPLNSVIKDIYGVTERSPQVRIQYR